MLRLCELQFDLVMIVSFVVTVLHLCELQLELVMMLVLW